MIAIITDILRLEEDDYYGSGQTGKRWKDIDYDSQ